MLQPYYYRQLSEGEQRLCHRQLPEALPESLQEAHKILISEMTVDDRKLDQVFSSLSPEDIKQIHQRLEVVDKSEVAMRAKALEQRVTSEVAQRNLKWLREVLSGRVEAGELNQTKSRSELEPNWWIDNGLNPNNWSEKARSNAIAIGIGVAVTALVMGGVWLWRKLSRGAEVAKEKAKQGWSWLKTTIVTGIAFGLGFLGFHGLKKAMQWLSPVQRLEESLIELKRQKQELEQKIADATAEQAEALKEQQRKLNELIGQYQAKIDSNKQQADTDAQVAPTSNDNSNASESNEILSQKEKESLKKDAWANLVGNLVDTSEWRNISRENKITQIKDVLEHNADLRIREVIKYSEALALDESSQSPFKNLSNDALSRQFAEFAVIDFIEKYSDQVVWHLVEVEGLNEREAQNKLNNLSVSKFFEYVTASFSMAVPLLDQLRKSDKQLADAISEVDIEAMARGDTALALTLEKAAKDLVESNGVELSDEELDKVSLRKLARLALTQGGGSAESKLASLANVTVPEEVLLREVYKEILEGNTHLYLLPLFHGERPDVPREGSEKYADVLKRIICTRLPANQAIRIFLYRKMIDDGNPLGLVLMQIEAIKILDNNDLYLPEKKYQVTKKIGAKALTGSFDEVVKKWQEHGLKVDKSIVDKALPILEEMGSIGLDAAKKIGTEKLALLYTLTIGTPTVLVSGGVVVPAISRRVILHRTNLDNIELILKSWKGFYEGREGELAHGVRKHLKWFRADDVEQAASAYLELRQKLGKVSINDPKLSESLRRQLRLCMRDPMNATKWKIFGDRLAQLHAAGKIEKGAVESVLKFAAKENRSLRSLLNIAVYQGKTNPGWIRRVIGFGARQFDTAWRGVKSLTPIKGVDKAKRTADFIEALKKELNFSETGRDITKLKQGVKEAHQIKPTGKEVLKNGVKLEDGTQRLWSRGDIIKKWRVLKEAGFEPKEIRFLLKNGWAGLDTLQMDEIAKQFKLGKNVNLLDEVVSLVMQPKTIDELRYFITEASDYKSARRALQTFLRSAENLDVKELELLLADEKLKELAKRSNSLDDLHRLQKATQLAGKFSASRAFGRLLSKGTMAIGIGILIEAFLIYLTVQELEAARKNNDKTKVALLENRLRDESIEAGVGIAGGAGLVTGVLSGPVGWTILAGVGIKSVTSGWMYSRAEEMGDIQLKKYYGLKTKDLLGKINGHGASWLDRHGTRLLRKSTALAAYIDRYHPPSLSPLDHILMRKRFEEESDWGESFNEVEYAKQLLDFSRTKKHFYIAKYLDYLGDNSKVTVDDIKDAAVYADLRMVQLRAEQLNDPSLFVSYVEPIGLPFGTKELEPADFANNKKNLAIYSYHNAKSVPLEMVLQRTLIDSSDDSYHSDRRSRDRKELQKDFAFMSILYKYIYSELKPFIDMQRQRCRDHNDREMFKINFGQAIRVFAKKHFRKTYPDDYENFAKKLEDFRDDIRQELEGKDFRRVLGY